MLDRRFGLIKGGEDPDLNGLPGMGELGGTVL